MTWRELTLVFLMTSFGSLPLVAAEVCPADAIVPGIDVSKWQGQIDWSAVADDGVAFAFIRVNHGLEDIDERFDENWEGAKNHGILRGAYQYFLNQEDALVQAELFLERMGPLSSSELPPVLDIEDNGAATPEELRAAIWTWLDRVESALGVKPILYTYRYFWETRVNTAEFEEAGYPLWFANYNVVCPNLPTALSRWDFWQKTDSGRVAGISTNVDLNEFNGDADALAAMTVPAAVCGDTYCTGDEDVTSCSLDCAGCRPIPRAGAVIDDLDACASFFGPAEGYRWNGDHGYGGSFRWTYAFASATPDNYGEYRLALEEAGDYEVWVYLDPDAAAGSTSSRYLLRHGNAEEEIRVDQANENGWVSLGVFGFVAGADQWLRVLDNTGEPFSERRRIVFDAVKLTRAGDVAPDGGGVPPDAVQDAGGEDVRPPDLPDAGDLPDASGFPDAGTQADAGPSEDGGTYDVTDDAGDGGQTRIYPKSVREGCSCQTSRDVGPWQLLLWGGIGGALGWRRRPRKTPRRGSHLSGPG